MFESRHQQLAHRHTFFLRVARNVLLGWIAIATAQFIGMLGYHHFENMTWVDAFINAAMILSGMGPLGTLATTGGKLFAGFYALFSGLAFILIIGLIYAPIIHRVFHKFHLEDDSEPKKKSTPSSYK